MPALVSLLPFLPLLIGAPLPSAPLVVIVRHAEKAASPAGDPALSAAGAARALALDSVLMETELEAVFVTPYRRTAETAAPVVKRKGLTPIAISPGNLKQYAKALADSVQARKQPVLIVTHGNLIPAILEALGGNRIPEVCETAYSHLFLVIPGTSASVVKGRYGARDPDGADDCHTGEAGG